MFDLTTYPAFVALKLKRGSDITAALTPRKANLIHCAMGVAGEAGELLDAIKKHAIYDKPLDRENIIEELGDLEFFMEALRQEVEVTREETLAQNEAKLSKRYPAGGYSDEHAQQRLDKEQPCYAVKRSGTGLWEILDSTKYAAIAPTATVRVKEYDTHTARRFLNVQAAQVYINGVAEMEMRK